MYGNGHVTEGQQNGNDSSRVFDPQNRSKSVFAQVTESVRQFAEPKIGHSGQSTNVHGEVVSAGHGFSSPVRRDLASEVPPLRRDYKERRGGGEVKATSGSGEVNKGSEPELGNKIPPPANSGHPARTDRSAFPPPPDLTPDQVRMLALLRQAEAERSAA